jgi:hypothetical protein
LSVERSFDKKATGCCSRFGEFALNEHKFGDGTTFLNVMLTLCKIIGVAPIAEKVHETATAQAHHQNRREQHCDSVSWAEIVQTTEEAPTRPNQGGYAIDCSCDNVTKRDLSKKKADLILSEKMENLCAFAQVCF